MTPTGNISGSTGSTTLTTQQIASHSHGLGIFNMQACNAPFCGSQYANNPTGSARTSSNTGGGQSHDHTLSANFSGSANSVLQPYLVLIYIIKT